MRFGFVGGSYIAQSINADDQRTVNFYPEIVSSQKGRNNVVLYRTPGLARFITGLAGRCRGLFALNGHIFAVMGNKVYDIVVATATATNLGTVVNDGNPVSMAANAETLFIISGGFGYRVFAGALSQIVDPDFPAGALVAGYIDGYFLAIQQSGIYSYMYFSALEDASSWDALDFVTVQASANALVSMIVATQQVLLFGNQLTQPFMDSGGDPPFVPIPGSTIDQGCAARFSVAKLDNSVFFLGSDQRGNGVVWRLQGFTPVQVSNHDLENAIQHYSRIDDAIAYGFQMNGHSFYQITFPTAGATWRYDTTTDMWHEALFWNQLTGTYEAHVSEFHCFEGGKHIVSDRRTGTLHEMNTTYLDDDGTSIRRLRRAPHLFDPDDNNWMIYQTFELIIQPGIGLNVAAAAAGYNPLITLRWSNDAGHTWSNEYTRSAGLVGQYQRRALWQRLGKARSSRVFEASMTDAVDWVLLDAVSRVKKGYA